MGMTYDQLLKTVRDYWGNQKRTPSQTRCDLQGLVDEIESLIDALPSDDDEDF